MPIGQEATPQPSTYAPEPVAPHPYQSAVMDRRTMRPDSLLTHIAGSSLTGTYYSQIRSMDDDLSGHQENRNAVLQQFKRIENFEVKLQQSVSYEQDQENRRYSGNLTVRTYPTGIVHNVGDHFIIRNLVNEDIMFQVDQVDRLSIYKAACYDLTLSPIGYAKDRQADMDNKTIDTAVFVRDFLSYGDNPVVNKGEFESLLELADLRRMLIADHYQRFFSRRFTTFLVPDQGLSVYDPYLARFVDSTYTMEDHLLKGKLTVYHTGRGARDNDLSIFKYLLDPDRASFSNVFRKAGTASSGSAGHYLSLFSLHTTSIQLFVHPVDPIYNVDDEVSGPPITPSAWITLSGDRAPVMPSIRTRLTDGEYEIPAVIPACKDNWYVFSEDFYNGMAKSVLEELVMAYMKKAPLNTRNLVAVTNTVQQWDNITRFYFIPVLALLIKRATRSL